MQNQQPRDSNPKTADSSLDNGPTYSVFLDYKKLHILMHVVSVFERAGFTRVDYNTSDDWSVMWAHEYPFTELKNVMMNMKSHQRVNKLPGSGLVTTKVNLATAVSPFIPKAFRVPNDNDKLRKYASENPDVMFVKKSNASLVIEIKFNINP